MLRALRNASINGKIGVRAPGDVRSVRVSHPTKLAKSGEVAFGAMYAKSMCGEFVALVAARFASWRISRCRYA